MNFPAWKKLKSNSFAKHLPQIKMNKRKVSYPAIEGLGLEQRLKEFIIDEMSLSSPTHRKNNSHNLFDSPGLPMELGMKLIIE